jgi:hypothetical protein
MMSSALSSATGHHDMALGQVIDGELIDLAGDGAGEGQIGFGTLEAFRLGIRDVGERAPRKSHVRFSW